MLAHILMFVELGKRITDIMRYHLNNDNMYRSFSITVYILDANLTTLTSMKPVNVYGIMVYSDLTFIDYFVLAFRQDR